MEKARKQIADLIGANPKEIVFTSGATESNNLAIKGVAEMYAERGNHIITAATEHKAMLDTCKKLEKHGCRVTYLPVKAGRPDRSRHAARSDHGQDDSDQHHVRQQRDRRDPADREIGKIARERGVLFHTDASAGGRQDSGQRDRRTTST